MVKGVVYSNEKCIKVFNKLQTYEEAKITCIQQETNNPSLITINSLEEQKFLESLFFDQNKIVDNIWLGAKRNNKTNQFEWDLNIKKKLTYSNWNGKLRNESHYNCVEIISDVDAKGKWINTDCNKKNIVVCQKNQKWGMDKM